MKRLLVLLTAAAALAQSAPETRPYSGNLDSQIQSEAATWFVYTIKSVPRDDENCWLETEGQNPKYIATPVALEGSTQAMVLIRTEARNVTKVRVLPAACPLDAGSAALVRLSGVPAAASVSYLEKLASTAQEKVVDGSLHAIAQHAGPEADSALDRLTQPPQPEHLREKAAFWLGASRGAPGVVSLNRIVHSDPSERVRDKAVFALSVSKQPEAVTFMIDAAKHDASSHVRSQALFWLAQKAGKRASETITNAIENDPDTKVKKQAVFALSQLPKDDGIPKLIQVASTQRNAEVRKQAFFWLGQSHDPRALAFIEDVLVK